MYGKNVSIPTILYILSDDEEDSGILEKGLREQCAGTYRILSIKLQNDNEKSLSILNELINKERPQLIVAKGVDAYNAMRCDRGENVDVIAVNPFLGEGLDEVPLWKFENVFALCSTRNESYGESYIPTIKNRYPDIHMTESDAFGQNLNKEGFRQLYRLIGSVAKYRRQCGEHMSLAEFEIMVRNRPSPDCPSYYRLQVWTYDKVDYNVPLDADTLKKLIEEPSAGNNGGYKRWIIDNTPVYRRSLSSTQAEFAVKDEALEAIRRIVASGNDDVCLFRLERLPFGVFDQKPFWLEAWTYDAGGNLIQIAPCSASHYLKAGIFGKFFGHLPERIRFHKSDIVQILRYSGRADKTFVTLGIVIDPPETISECYTTYIYARERWIKDGKNPDEWLETTVYPGSDEDEMFIQYGPYDEDWCNFTLINPMMVIPAPENLPDDIIAELRSWYADWHKHKDDTQE